MKNINKAKDFILIAFLLGAFLFVVYATVELADVPLLLDTVSAEITTETEFSETTEEIVMETETEISFLEQFIHIEAEVLNYNMDTGIIEVVMPNGEIHSYFMPDVPINEDGTSCIKSVVLMATRENEEDYIKYQVVLPIER
jgi:hypothetical protein